MAETTVKSAGRVLDIFETLAASPSGLSFTALHLALSIPKSSLHALLEVLTARSYVECESVTRVYTVGLRLWERGQAYSRHHDLLHEALPIMRDIGHAINETVQLAVLDGIENVYLAKVDSTHPLRLQSEVGGRLPAYATGVGKVLLAHLAPGEIGLRFGKQPFQRFTPNTLADPTLLEVELARVYARGFAVDNQEYTQGLCCIAAPIAGPHGGVVAAISISIPRSRATLGLFSTALAQIASASLQIAARLGQLRPDPRLAALVDPEGAWSALDMLVVAGVLDVAPGEAMS